MLIDAQDSMLQDISAKKPQPVKHVWLDLRGYHMIAMDDILSILHNKPPTEPRGIAERSFLMAVYATRFDVMQHVRDTLNKWLVSKVPTVDRPVGESPTMDQVIVMLMASLIVDNVDAAKMWYWVLLTRYSSDYASALLDHSNWAVSHQYYGQEEWENINEFLNPEFLSQSSLSASWSIQLTPSRQPRKAPQHHLRSDPRNHHRDDEHSLPQVRPG